MSTNSCTFLFRFSGFRGTCRSDDVFWVLTVQDCGWSVMLQRNMPPSLGVTGFCPGICRKKGRITALQER
jgi:hypothetical protein